VPCIIELLSRTPQPAKVLTGAPRAGRIDHRKLVFAEAARRWRQIRLVPLFSVIKQMAKLRTSVLKLGNPAYLGGGRLTGHNGGVAGVQS
jgi:hypothetical protein